MEAAMQHHIGSYAPRDRLAVGSYREANDTMSAAERVPLLAADSRRIAAALEASVVDPESLVASVSGRDDGAASSRDGRGQAAGDRGGLRRSSASPRSSAHAVGASERV